MLLIYNFKELWVMSSFARPSPTDLLLNIQKVSFTPQPILKIQDFQESCNLFSQSSERWAGHSDFKMTLYLWGFNKQRKLDYICLLKIFLMYNFELIWACLAMLDQSQFICDSITTKFNFIILWILEVLDF